jgi:hypothetical protein
VSWTETQRITEPVPGHDLKTSIDAVEERWGDPEKQATEADIPTMLADIWELVGMVKGLQMALELQRPRPAMSSAMPPNWPPKTPPPAGPTPPREDRGVPMALGR